MKRSWYGRGIAAVEAEPEGQVVSQRDQPRVQRQLGQRVAMDGKAAERIRRRIRGSVLGAPAEGRTPNPPSRADRRASAGSRRMRGARSAPARRSSTTSSARSSRRSRPSAIRRSSTAPEPALERRPHRRAERDRLAVHRPAGADHEVGVGDQRLGVDRALGHDEAAARGPARPAARRVRGSTTTCSPAQALEHLGEDRRSRSGGRATTAGGVRTTASGCARVEAELVEHRRGRARSRPGSTPPSGPA